jgi:hypothetical protein
LTIAQRYLRLKWCRAHEDWDASHWRRIIFSDESRFTLEMADGRIRVHRRKNERDMQECMREHDKHGRGGVMVWGAIGFNCKSRLLFIDGTLTSQRYITDVLEVEAVSLVLESPRLIYQQDNARPHSARSTMNYLTSMGVDVLPWPARSPDLNPIEHLWDMLQRRLHDNYAELPANVQMLRTRLQQQWDEIQLSEINDLCDSMTRRLRACMDVRGGHTSY